VPLNSMAWINRKSPELAGGGLSRRVVAIPSKAPGPFLAGGWRAPSVTPLDSHDQSLTSRSQHQKRNRSDRDWRAVFRQKLRGERTKSFTEPVLAASRSLVAASAEVWPDNSRP